MKSFHWLRFRISVASWTGVVVLGVTALCAARDDAPDNESTLSAAVDGSIRFLSTESFDLPLDTEAGEHQVEGEEEAIRNSKAILLKVVENAYGDGKKQKKQQPLRDVHALSPGCVRAKVIVPNLVADLRQGVFATATTYDALIRFSNGDGVGAGHAPEEDSKSMMRGMAIKMLGIEGKKLLGSQQDATTQDFLLVNRSEFFLRNIVDYSGAMASVDHQFSGFLFHHPTTAAYVLWRGLGMKLFEWFDKNQIDNPLNTSYYSKLPFRFGPLVVKYRTRPCNPVPVVVPSDPPPRYLRAAMKAKLDPSKDGDKEGACFVLELQRRNGEPIEDATVHWNAPFEEIARISVPKQNFDTDEENMACENLSYTPWHTLTEHRPLGSLNRARYVVYSVLSKFRLSENAVPLQEPK